MIHMADHSSWSDRNLKSASLNGLNVSKHSWGDHRQNIQYLHQDISQAWVTFMSHGVLISLHTSSSTYPSTLILC